MSETEFARAERYWHEVCRLQKERDQLKAENEDLSESYLELETKYKATFKAWLSLEQENSKLKNESEKVHRCESSVNHLFEENQKLREENENLKTPLLPGEISRFRLREENKKLRARVAALRDALILIRNEDCDNNGGVLVNGGDAYRRATQALAQDDENSI